MWGPEPELTLGTRDRSGEVTGYREWTLVDSPDGPRLRSVWSRTVWMPGQLLEAECRAPLGWINAWAWRTAQSRFPHRFAPDPRCRCGISARTTRPRPPEVDVGIRIHGLVRGWGLVVSSTSGWRAQYAEPAALLADSVPPEIRDRLAADYGLAVL